MQTFYIIFLCPIYLYASKNLVYHILYYIPFQMQMNQFNDKHFYRKKKSTRKNRQVR